MNKDRLNYLSKQVVSAAINVHKELGPGLLESVYEYCLMAEFRNQGLYFNNQIKIPVVYKGEILNKEFFIDILVENELVIELKAVEVLLPVHEVQLVTYLKLADKRLGLLINFNVPLLKDGIRRRVNGF